MHVLPLFLAISPALGVLLVDYDASKGTDPSVIGGLNLEAARGDKTNDMTPDLYIKPGNDPNGTPAAHFHRKQGDIRAEYHALRGKTEANKTYNITYDFSMGQIQQSLMVFQFHEYIANNDQDGGANIPFALEVKDGELRFQYQANGTVGREKQWATTVVPNERYRAGIVINTSTPGWVQLSWNGESQKLGADQTTQMEAITFPGRADPKFGSYRGEEIDIDTWVYLVQIDEVE